MVADPEIPDHIRECYDNKPEDTSWDDHMVVVVRMCEQALYVRAKVARAASPRSREVKGTATVSEASDHGDPDEDTEETGYSTQHGNGFCRHCSRSSL